MPNPRVVSFYEELERMRKINVRGEGLPSHLSETDEREVFSRRRNNPVAVDETVYAVGASGNAANDCEAQDWEKMNFAVKTIRGLSMA